MADTNPRIDVSIYGEFPGEDAIKALKVGLDGENKKRHKC
jgi:hypothetical protein